MTSPTPGLSPSLDSPSKSPASVGDIFPLQVVSPLCGSRSSLARGLSFPPPTGNAHARSHGNLVPAVARFARSDCHCDCTPPPPPQHPPPVRPARQLRCRPRNGLARRCIHSAPRETATIGVSGFGSRVSRLRRPSTVHRIEPAAFPTFGQDGFAALDAASRPNATDESRIPLLGISLSRLRPASPPAGRPTARHRPTPLAPRDLALVLHLRSFGSYPPSRSTPVDRPALSWPRWAARPAAERGFVIRLGRRITARVRWGGPLAGWLAGPLAGAFAGRSALTGARGARPRTSLILNPRDPSCGPIAGRNVDVPGCSRPLAASSQRPLP